ncbi:hypothetical protein ED5_2270 [Enterobacter roggenkampii]|uniref:hypothetical protein n=1 Tax=Enterobacter roggenkampii TaxID=1812935 RepID=UPI0015A64670|nr:hypothetical protein [Enterobacter roggenkampii]QLC82921.1 hypothetical protein ED5_2270 [Enterobacter roggenkampii]HEO9336923.1 hypothetical protein [Enterobacter roggenkampii]
MIKFAYRQNSSQILEVRNDFIKTHMCTKAKEIIDLCEVESPEWHFALNKILSYTNLIKIVFAKAEHLALIKNEFTRELPLISERYNPQVFFMDLKVDDFYLSLKLNSKTNKAAIMSYKSHMLVELKRFEITKKSRCANYIATNLLGANTPSLVRKCLVTVQALSKGFPKEIKNNFNVIFPSWVNKFPEIFNYALLSSKFGYDIVGSSGLKVCPFCNEEKINTVIGDNKNSRPALDHFYAKSKYPYLAVTLSNLIPIGGRCNTAFKSDEDMFDGFMNPLISGMNDKQLFDFTYNALENTVSLEIRESDEFILNKILFELNSVYNTDEYKGKYLDFKYLYDYHKGLGVSPPFYENAKLMASTFNVSDDKNYFTWPAKKFELDALDDIFKFE